MARARATRCDRVSSGGESRAESPIGGTPAALERWATAASRGARAAARTRRTARRGDACHARHHSAMASRTDCAEMDLHQAATRPTWGARRDSASGPADGDGESELGLHAHSGGAEERGPSRGSIHDCGHPEGRRHSTQWRAADHLAHVSPRALARPRGADFFTTEVWTPRGLVTYYTLFVLELQSRRVHVTGSTPSPG